MPSITSANAVLMLSISQLFTVPQQLQGFAADDIYDLDPIATAETLMGVDGTLSAGFVFAAQKQKISLQADSPSNAIFETWWRSQKMISDVYRASGTITLPAVNKKYTMTRGVLTSFPVGPSAKRVLQPRVYEITWEAVTAAPISLTGS